MDKVSVALTRDENGSCEQIVVLTHVNKQELAKLFNESKENQRKKEAKLDTIIEENQLLKAKIEELEKEIKYLKGE